MSAEIIPFRPRPSADEPQDDASQPRQHCWWSVENYILTTLAIAYAVLVWGGHIKLIAQFISRIF